MRYVWQKTSRSDDLTIIIVARDLVHLCYPFIESLISTIPLGCRYLIGNFGTDDTVSIYKELGKYVPIDIIDLEWPSDPGWGGAAIGVAIQRLLEKSPTEYALNLQACEFHCDDAIQATLGEHPNMLPGQIGPRSYLFRHFYGHLNHGGLGYGGYHQAPRLVHRDTKYDKTDGYIPNEFDYSAPTVGHVNRYGYCHKNTIEQKMRNHAAIYHDGNPEPKIAGTINLGKTQTWFDEHMPCVQHLISLENYDVNHSLEFAKQNLL